MSKIIINTRNHLTSIETDLIAAVKADGNYCRVYYINKREVGLTIGISRLEEMLRTNGGKRNRFIRISRSIIINHFYLHIIDLQRQLVVLTDGGTQEIRLNLSKKLIKPYKEAVVQSIKIRNNHGKDYNPGQAGQPAF